VMNREAEDRLFRAGAEVETPVPTGPVVVEPIPSISPPPAR
jgi:hypothetical protein